MRALLTLSLLAAAATAQVTFDVPNLPSFVNVDRPFPGGLGRYQQWFSASSIATNLSEPMRFQQIEYLAGTTPTSQAVQIDCEILMGHGKASGVTGVFDNNWSSPPVVVKPQGIVQLSAGTPGQVVMTLPFTNYFTWDGARPILIEIRIFGNSVGNQPFTYNFRGTTQSLGVTSRVYAPNSPGAPTGTVAQGVGMVTRFTARPGAVVQFGVGCPGEGGFVPANTVLQVPSPGIAWGHRVENAASGRLAFWVIGGTRDAPYPIEIAQLLFGAAPTSCYLRTDPANVIGVTTVGGGAGAGIGSLSVLLPATTNYVGLYVYTQWVVFDPLAPNGVLSVTPAAWSIVAPVGG